MCSAAATARGKKGGHVGKDRAAESAAAEVEVEDMLTDEADNLFEGKATHGNVKEALRSRAADSIRYEYLAHRADIECEVESAQLFRSLSESCKQQSMGFLELLEEYGDSQFASTLDNVLQQADCETSLAEGVLRTAANAAADDGLEQVEEWFDDLADASLRAANRLNALHNAMEDEIINGDLNDHSDSDNDAETTPPAADVHLNK